MSEKRVFGIDVGGTRIKEGLFDEEGNLLEKWDLPTDISDGGSHILPDAAASVLEKMQIHGIEPADVLGVGLAIPGVVLPDGMVKRAVNLGWGVMDAEGDLSKLLGGMIPTAVGNDANVAALGEAWKGAGIGHRSLVMLTIGTGLGGGIIVDGKILVGMHGVAGEIGHMHLYDGETEPCSCGGYGCAEQRCSATGLVRIAHHLLDTEQDVTSVLRAAGEGLTSRTVMVSAKSGDRIAEEAVEEFARNLGQTLASAAMIVDPEIFIIGGGVSAAGTFLTERVKKYYIESSPLSEDRADVVPAALGNEAGIYGAAALAIGFQKLR